jgi:hypothetical protein
VLGHLGGEEHRVGRIAGVLDENVPGAKELTARPLLSTKKRCGDGIFTVDKSPTFSAPRNEPVAA